ncbi:MAG: formate dehydrogenase accessory sulfurtransferase FdhD [Bacteroidetes bacterium]|nr:formate dehydrogenase accessory sulfurtransferase FdhD [Bacteroidota bacterium]
MAKPGVHSVQIQKVIGAERASTPDLVATEEPLEIRVWFGPAHKRQKKTISVTMRTPGNDFELALGFLFTEGILKSYNDVKTVRFCEDVDTSEAVENIVIVELKDGVEFNADLSERNFYMTSSCGVCGKASIEAIENQNCSSLLVQNDFVAAETIKSLPSTLLNHQKNFGYTGGIHAAALFSTKGELVLCREDVGRHNALDKLIGAIIAQENIDPTNCLLLVSGRTSFELVQKAVLAQIPVIAAVGAPSSLAVETARNFNQTLIGFLKESRFNIYSNPERITF